MAYGILENIVLSQEVGKYQVALIKAAGYTDGPHFSYSITGDGVEYTCMLDKRPNDAEASFRSVVYQLGRIVQAGLDFHSWKEWRCSLRWMDIRRVNDEGFWVAGDAVGSEDKVFFPWEEVGVAVALYQARLSESLAHDEHEMWDFCHLMDHQDISNTVVIRCGDNVIYHEYLTVVDPSGVVGDFEFNHRSFQITSKLCDFGVEVVDGDTDE